MTVRQTLSRYTIHRSVWHLTFAWSLLRNFPDGNVSEHESGMLWHIRQRLSLTGGVLGLGASDILGRYGLGTSAGRRQWFVSDSDCGTLRNWTGKQE